jgi:glycosyltransferase involved in cell wall biosynthesis
VDPSHSRQSVVPSLLWLGSYGEATGLADEIRGFLRALDARGLQPAIRPFLKPRHQIELLPDDSRVINAALKHEPKAPCVAVHHYITNRQQTHIDGAVNVARVMFETDRMPAPWLELLLQRDQIWVPCEHNAEAFRRGGIPASKIRVLGETIDFDLFQPGAEPYELSVEDGRFTFLSNFDFGERKGWRRLIAGWAKAFTADDPVCLVLKTGSYTHGEEYAADRIRAFVREHLGAGAEQRMAPIEILSARLPAEELPSLYAAADAYVLASRGEGWGRPYMEAMAMGLPTIGSRWSGNLDFMNDGNSWLVDGELVPVPEDAELFPTRITRGHNWFEPDVDSLAEALRDVARNTEASAARAAGARSELIEKFGTEAIVERIAELATDAYERARRPYTCAIRGTFGSNASLAVVNDGIAGALDERGQNVIFRDTYSEMLINELPGVTHSWPPVFDAVTMGPTVMILPWEYGSPPKEWVEGVRARVDRVWVPSAYVRDCYIEGGMPPGVIEVVPNGVDLERFTPEGPSYELPSKAACTFLFVGGSIWRKGVDVLLSAWAEAFGPDDDVQLVIKDFGTKTHYKSQHAGDRVAELMQRDDIAPVIYLTDDMTPEELASLYRASDVFVTPYRGEGFCLPALEAMASGLPVIHNGAGPTSEFVPEDGGWKIPAEREPLREDVKLPEMVTRGFIHEPDKDALVEILRSVAAAPEDRRARGSACHVRAQDYHWHKITAIAEESLATFAAEGLPLAREVGTAELERREELVLYSPDWEREDHWGPTLERWAAAVGQDDPVTLALHLPAGDPSELAGRILAHLEAAGHSEDDLPDIALCEPDSASIASLVAAADAVLIHPDEADRPELCRRARRLVHATPEGLLDYAAQVRADAQVTESAATP